jgi:pimeloyl-ACP methyl ester carboxylesterase
MIKKATFKNGKGNKLYGILSNPTPDMRPPIIIMCHGFSTSKDGRTPNRLEQLFNKEAIPTFRFDFYGHGESEGKFEDITISEAVDDIQKAIQYLKSLGYKKFGLIGSSFGGMASIIAASSTNDLLTLALKSPVSDYLGLLIAQDHNQKIKTWKEKGFMSITGANGEMLKLNYLFFEDASRMRGYEAAKKIKIPTLIVHGDKDETVPIEQSMKTSSLIDGCQLETIQGADHIYSNPLYFEKALSLIAQFVIKNSKILKNE